MLNDFNSKNEFLNFVENNFINCFSKKGYIIENPVAITSKIDSSVNFIGSSISPLKKDIINGTIGKKGKCLIQNSLRTQSLKNILNEQPSIFGSYFKNLGLLIEPDLDKIINDTFDYLLNYINIDKNDLRIKINSNDTDLIKSIQDVDKEIIREFDTHDLNYYKHKYGMDNLGIKGRNFNIAVRKHDTNQFIDIGNIIIIEDNEKTHAIELGLGNCTLSMCKFGENSTVAASRMADIMKINNIEEQKFADSIIAVSVLQNENVTKNPKFHRFRSSYKKYNEAINFWKNHLNIQDDEIYNYMEKFINLEYNKNFEGEYSWIK